jgi:hypothetical protein
MREENEVQICGDRRHEGSGDEFNPQTKKQDVK